MTKEGNQREAAAPSFSFDKKFSQHNTQNIKVQEQTVLQMSSTRHLKNKTYWLHITPKN